MAFAERIAQHFDADGNLDDKYAIEMIDHLKTLKQLGPPAAGELQRSIDALNQTVGAKQGFTITSVDWNARGGTTLHLDQNTSHTKALLELGPLDHAPRLIAVHDRSADQSAEPNTEEPQGEKAFAEGIARHLNPQGELSDQATIEMMNHLRTLKQHGNAAELQESIEALNQTIGAKAGFTITNVDWNPRGGTTLHIDQNTSHTKALLELGPLDKTPRVIPVHDRSADQ